MGYLEREIVLESDGVLPALISRRTHIRGAMLRGDIVRVFFSPSYPRCIKPNALGTRKRTQGVWFLDRETPRGVIRR